MLPSVDYREFLFPNFLIFRVPIATQYTNELEKEEILQIKTEQGSRERSTGLQGYMSITVHQI